MGLFSNTGKKISDTVNNVQKKTEDFLKVRKIQGQIRSAEEEIQRLYTAAGKCCYEAHLTGTGAESAAALYDNITELRAAIEKYTEEIDAINRVRRCPACNARGQRIPPGSAPAAARRFRNWWWSPWQKPPSAGKSARIVVRSGRKAHGSAPAAATISKRKPRKTRKSPPMKTTCSKPASPLKELLS